MDLLANKVLGSILSLYGSLNSYSDLAVVKTVYRIGTTEEWTSEVLLRTSFKKPYFFRFDRRMGAGTNDSQKDNLMVVLFDGKKGQVCYSEGKFEQTSGPLSALKNKEVLISDCLNNCFVFAGSVDTVIHPMLFPNLLSKSKLKNESWSCDLTASNSSFYCLRSSSISIYVDRETFLIKRIDDIKVDDDSQCTTTFHTQNINENCENSLFDPKIIAKEVLSCTVLQDLKNEIGALIKRS